MKTLSVKGSFSNEYQWIFVSEPSLRPSKLSIQFLFAETDDHFPTVFPTCLIWPAMESPQNIRRPLKTKKAESNEDVATRFVYKC